MRLVRDSYSFLFSTAAFFYLDAYVSPFYNKILFYFWSASNYSCIFLFWPDSSLCFWRLMPYYSPISVNFSNRFCNSESCESCLDMTAFALSFSSVILSNFSLTKTNLWDMSDTLADYSYWLSTNRLSIFFSRMIWLTFS